MQAASNEVLPREARSALYALFGPLDALTLKLDAVDREFRKRCLSGTLWAPARTAR